MKRALVVAAALVAGCSSSDPQASQPAEPAPTATPAPAVDAKYTALFRPLGRQAPSKEHPFTDAKADLGRMLYFDRRLSSTGEVSCNDCHLLDQFGVDGKPTSTGINGQVGGRNAPTVYNAAFHATQFWDGREPDVEAQAKGPILNPIEMGMPDAASVEAKLRGIPGYVTAFEAAFPGAGVTYDGLGEAIGAFERRLVTPGPFDDFLRGDASALTEAQQAGLDLFIATGCVACHGGALLGGTTFQKLGAVKPYETADVGRKAVTGADADAYVFKVPSLRNIARTGPWLHDGSITDLGAMVRLMATHQLGRELDEAAVASIVEFLGALTGEPDAAYIAQPALPPDAG